MGEPRKFTKHTMPRHVRALRQQCGHMAHAYNVGGMPPARDREGGFRTLLRIIVDQQISVHAGAAIWAKLEKRLTDITAARVLAVQEHTLQECGLSGQKIRYARELAKAIHSGDLDLEADTGQLMFAISPEDMVVEDLHEFGFDMGSVGVGCLALQLTSSPLFENLVQE